MSKKAPKRALIDETKSTKQKNSNIKKPIIITIIILILLAAIASISYKIYKTPQNTQNTISQSTTTPTNTTVSITHPLQDLYPNAPQATTQEITITTDKDTLKTSNNNTLKINNSTMKISAENAKVTNPTDFTIAATNTNNNLTYPIYYFKDAVHSKMFYNLNNFKQINIPNAKTAATFTLDIGDNQQHPCIIIVNNDGSGWLIMLDQKDEPQITNIIQNTTA